MNYQHKTLSAGRWSEMPFVEQMANIGSEIERALNWQNKNNREFSLKAFERSLELLDLTIANATTFSRLKELTRLREGIADYFLGQNQFKFDDLFLKKYFNNFLFAANKNR